VGYVDSATADGHRGGEHAGDAKALYAPHGTNNINNGVDGANFVKVHLFYGGLVYCGFFLGNAKKGGNGALFYLVAESALFNDAADFCEAAMGAMMMVVILIVDVVMVMSVVVIVCVLMFMSVGVIVRMGMFVRVRVRVIVVMVMGVAMIMRMFMRMSMRVLVIVAMWMIMGVCMIGQPHVNLCSTNAAALDVATGDFVPIYGELCKGRPEFIKRDTGIYERTQNHIATYATKTVKIRHRHRGELHFP
jgi:hypothetical protein